MLSKGSYLKHLVCLQLLGVTSSFFHRDTERVRFASELIELHLEGLPSVSLSVLGIAQHSASEGRLDVSLVIELHNIQPHSHISQHLVPTVRLGLMTNTDSAGNYRHGMKMLSIISCLPRCSFCLERRLALYSA